MAAVCCFVIAINASRLTLIETVSRLFCFMYARASRIRQKKIIFRLLNFLLYCILNHESHNMPDDNTTNHKPTAAVEPIRITCVVTQELDSWLEAEAKRCMQGKAAIVRLYLAEAYQRAQAESAPTAA